MRVLALIPARGGSKGIPRKNLAPLGGRPLIAWTVLAALDAGCFSQVVVSTDDHEIAAIAKSYGAEVPFLRPEEFSSDMASAVGVIEHALAYFAGQGEIFDAVAYLQPTSPFRTAGQLANAHRQYMEMVPDTIVSVTKVPHNMTSGSVMRSLECADTLWLESPHGQVMRRQDKETLFARNGPAILFVSAQDVREHGRLYGERVLGFEMGKLHSFDIDDPVDLEMARCLAPLALGFGVDNS
ncbi:acylneuraminate cytidylyltransferase family protein (plasmid) [Rhizobium sp. WL3]|uniref:acylneuraminate cytidylyltransferase family protein n=1 Tax=Rhizobium sp. WL3 TaxID=2603277 RepID=UPI0011C1D480|nr:acylneuraminate cytidylyltransferase family protein [Rhizobium sp. WL3]QEE43680.1 acylneuraminate cytidylyltransferase family protein [Rhizobium sp. WL3]